MRVSSLSDHILVCDPALLQHLVRVGLHVNIVHLSESLALAELATSIPEVDETLTTIGASRTPRYLDRFYLCFGLGSGHQAVLDSLFELIGSEYDSLVDVARNRHNIRLLLRLIEREVGSLKGRRVVDFGCGTGLSLEIAQEHDIVLLGCDSCPTMRSVAASRGMAVFAPGEFRRMPAGSVDAIFASYVFHLTPDVGSLEIVWDRVHPGGVVAVNLHKNQGYPAISALMSRLNAVRTDLEPEGGEKHGRYLVYRKVV